MLIVLFGAIYDALPLIPLAIGLVWTLRYQKVADLSLAGSFAISAGVTASLLHSGHDPIVSIVCGIFIGMCIGLLMGFSVNILRIDALMAGLIVLFIAYAISLGITQGTVSIPNQGNPLTHMVNLERSSDLPYWVHPILNPLFLFVGVLAISISSLVFSSEWGCAYRALEDQIPGMTFLRSLGISSGRMSTIGFIVAATLASISGILVALRDGQATSSLGLDILIEIIPAYLLGGAIFEKKPNLKFLETNDISKSWNQRLRSASNQIFIGVKFASPSIAAGLGVVIFFVVVNAAQRWTGIPWLPRVVIGVTILGALGGRPAIQQWLRSKRQNNSTTTLSLGNSLEVSDLTVSYPTIEGRLDVLNNMAFSASPGSIVLISGPNGSGKTTFLKALTDQIDSFGDFKIPVNDSQKLSKNQLYRSELVAFIPQHAALATAGSLSIAEHAALSHSGRSLSIFRRWRSTADIAVPLLQISDVTRDPNVLLKWLSGGQIRRVLLGLIRTRQKQPIVVAMDEPYSHLDLEGQRQCTKLIEEYAENNGIVLLVDHGSHVQSSNKFDISGLNKSGVNGLV